MVGRRVLIVDDDPQIRMLLRDRLESHGYRVREAEDGPQALDLAVGGEFGVVLLDLQMPKMDGLEVLARLRERDPDITVVILTAHGTVASAVEAMKRGAYDFLPKPCKPDHVLATVRRALERKGLRDENRYLRSELESQYHMLVGRSPLMQKVMGLVERVAPTRTTVLVVGESGTGKQLLARAVHNMSDRKDRPFLQVTCTTLSEQLMESDMFGHEKGAFTGAIKQKKGRFELADKGTLFLDEIGDLSIGIQAKLLHVLEYGEFQRVGGVETLSADVRVLVATNKDLQHEVQERRFREDLYYRLNVMAINLPPLRERTEDIPLFAEHFLQKHSRAMGKRISRLAPDAMDALMEYSWPGNIRELENAIERAVVLAAGDQVTADLLPTLSSRPGVEDIGVGTPLHEATRSFKKRFIAKNLRRTGNNQTRAAELLKIQRTYLNRLIKELDIKP